MTRREFVAMTIAMTVAPPEARGAPASSEIPRRKLGRTGEEVSALGLGGAHIGMQKEERESIRIIRTAVDEGITFLDNCWDYHGGQSEIRMGKALRDGYRRKVFLMTKIDGRDRRTAARQIDESLRRLQTDHLDLLQLHEVIRASDVARTEAAARGGGWEQYKTTRHFDGTEHNPEWLGHPS